MKGCDRVNLERALELLKIEKKCISKSDTCDRKCSNCALVQDSEELLDMYNFVINCLMEYRKLHQLYFEKYSFALDKRGQNNEQ